MPDYISFTTAVNGLSFRKDYPHSVLALYEGERVTLVRDPDNTHDPHAVKVYTRGDINGHTWLGFLPSGPGGPAERVARWMDAHGEPYLRQSTVEKVRIKDEEEDKPGLDIRVRLIPDDPATDIPTEIADAIVDQIEATLDAIDDAVSEFTDLVNLLTKTRS